MNALTRKLITVILAVGAVYSVTNCRYTTKEPVTNKTIGQEGSKINGLQSKLATLTKLESQKEAGTTNVSDDKLTQAQKNVQDNAEEAVNYLAKLNPANWTTTTQVLAATVALAGLAVGVDFGVNKLMMDRETYLSKAYGLTSSAAGSAYTAAKGYVNRGTENITSGARRAWNWIWGTPHETYREQANRYAKNVKNTASQVYEGANRYAEMSTPEGKTISGVVGKSTRNYYNPTYVNPNTQQLANESFQGWKSNFDEKWNPTIEQYAPAGSTLGQEVANSLSNYYGQ